MDTRLLWVCLAKAASESDHLYSLVRHGREDRLEDTDCSGPKSHMTFAHM